MTDWVENLHEASKTGQAIVLVTVIDVRGSAPREVGAKMIVSANGCSGSIGGGQLEYQCQQIATKMLGRNAGASRQKFSLGKKMEQCCGGVVEVSFESLPAGCPAWLKTLLAFRLQAEAVVVATGFVEGGAKKTVIDPHGTQTETGLPGHLVQVARDLIATGASSRMADNVFLDVVSTTALNIVVFGAGHVGSALVETLSGLDAQIRWVDSRPDTFQSVPQGVQTQRVSNPLDEVANAPRGSFYLVMTHSHATDFELCQAILTRGDAAYCGLIGSRSKRRQFEKRLRSNGLDQAQINQLVCPIGVDGIGGKSPKEIAIAAAAEILQLYQRRQAVAATSN